MTQPKMDYFLVTVLKTKSGKTISTRYGKVFGWGSDRHGQLGLFVPDGSPWFAATERKKPSSSKAHSVHPYHG